MYPALGLLKTKLQDISRIGTMCLAILEVHGTNSVFEDVISDCSTNPVRSDEPSNGFVNRCQITQPPAFPSLGNILEATAIKYYTESLCSVVGGVLFPCEDVLEQEATVFEGIDDSVYRPTSTENEKRRATLYFRHDHGRPRFTPLFVFFAHISVCLGPTVYRFSSPFEGCPAHLRRRLAKER